MAEPSLGVPFLVGTLCGLKIQRGDKGSDSKGGHARVLEARREALNGDVSVSALTWGALPLMGVEGTPCCGLKSKQQEHPPFGDGRLKKTLQGEECPEWPATQPPPVRT